MLREGRCLQIGRRRPFSFRSVSQLAKALKRNPTGDLLSGGNLLNAIRRGGDLSGLPEQNQAGGYCRDADKAGRDGTHVKLQG